MIVRWIWMLLSLSVLSESALVRSYACSGLNLADISFKPLFTEVFFDKANEMLRVKLITNITESIIDINDTTNMYTTLHVQVEFTGGKILSKYLRLCEYVTRASISDLPLPVHNSSFPFHDPSAPIPSAIPLSSSSLSMLPTSSGIYSQALISTFSSADASAVITSNTDMAQSTVPTPTAATAGPSVAVVTDNPDVATPTVATYDPDADAAAQTTVLPQVNGKRDFDDQFQGLVPRDDDEEEDAVNIETTNICPLLQNELVEINYNISIGKYHKFGSYDLRFSIISADSSQKIIGCNRFYVTPELPSTATRGIAIGVVVLAVWMAAMSFFTLVFSPYQESQNPFLLFCSTICNAPLLNQLSPPFDDFIVYVHFAFFMAALDIQYPGFYQPLVASIRWLALISSCFQTEQRKVVMDKIYVTYGNDPLASLVLFSTSDGLGSAWSNFMELFAAIMAVVLALTFISTLVLWLKNKNNADYKGFQGKIFYHTLGLLCRFLFFVFATPFLILTIALWIPSVNEGITKVELGFSAVLFFMWVSTAVYFIVKYIFIGKNRPRLYSSLKVILLWSALYHKYDPSKVFYFIFEVFEMLIFSFVIGLLGNYGAVQVSIIIVVEVFSLICLIYVKPYYLKTRLNISKIAIVVAKLITSILSIPYIRSLNVSEKNRTYVAYAEAFLHLFVFIVIFFIPSLYCAVATIISIVKNRSGRLNFDEKDDADVPLSNKNSYINLPQTTTNTNDDFSYNNGFSYYRQPHQTNNTNVSWPQALYRQESNISMSTTNLELTDTRALPFVGLPTSPDEASGVKKVDYSVREVDKFYNASRILEPDPEVKKLWEAREGRKHGNNNNNNNNDNNADFNDMPQRSVSPNPQSSFQYTPYQQQPQLQRSQKRLKWLFQRKQQKPVTRGFEVDRPRPLIVQRPSSRFDDTTTTEIGSSIMMKEEEYEDLSSEAATRTSFKHYDDDDDDDFGVEEKLLDNEFMVEKPARRIQHQIIAEENEEDDLSVVGSSGSDAEFISIQDSLQLH